MLEFYSFSGNAILFLCMVSALCLAAQTIAMSASINRHKNRAVLWLECILEVFILLQVLVLALLISQVRVNIESLHIADTGFTALRYILFGSVA